MNHQPPKRALKFLRWFCREDFIDEIEGDLVEIFELHYQENPKKASRSFWWQVILHFRPDYIKSFHLSDYLIQRTMLYINFKLAWRHILKKKLFSFINILGLGVGIASCLIIFLYIQFELSFDKYHKNLNNTYRVLHAYRNLEEQQNPITPEDYQVWGNAPVAEAMLRDFPEVKSTFRFTSDVEFLLQYKDRLFQEDHIIFADANAFDLFSWRMLEGDPKTALKEPNSLVLTKKLATKYFGNEEAVGKTIKVDGSDVYKITAVMENVPANSHFKFDGMVSMNTFQKYRPNVFEMWDYVDFYTYFTLEENTSLASLNKKADEFAKKYTKEWAQTEYRVAFEPAADAYLHSKAARQPGEVGSITNLYIFGAVGIFILLIACINFVNLSTARSVERAKEVGIRKVAGAHKSTLTFQFLAEFILLSTFGVLLALLLVIYFAPILQDMTGKQLNYQIFFSWQFGLSALVGILFLGTTAGLYPAWMISGYSPALVLKGRYGSSTKGLLLRKVLVVCQFGLSIALMIGTAIVFSQLQFLQSKNLGFKKEQMLILDFAWDNKVKQQMDAIEQTFLAHPNITAVSASRAVPGDFLPNAGTTIEDKKGEMTMNNPTIYEIDNTFIQNYGIEMAAGRAFSEEFPSDSLHALILNEAAIAMWGYENPEEIIGKSFRQWGKEGTVIGVVKDFNYQSLHKKVEPLSLRYEPRSLRKFSIRIKSDNLSSTLADIENIWKDLAPHRPFVYTFLDDNFNRQHKADEQFGSIFGVFAGIAIFVACLGLFGLTAYTTSQRTKEIGIRKVLGASSVQIVALLSSSFLKLFAVAMVIAVPASWFFMKNWLNGFAYRTDINFWVFGLAGLLALSIALITISWQSFKAAMANPIDSLRSE